MPQLIFHTGDLYVEHSEHVRYSSLRLIFQSYTAKSAKVEKDSYDSALTQLNDCVMGKRSYIK